jgi:hypothetical protein
MATLKEAHGEYIYINLYLYVQYDEMRWASNSHHH